MIHDTSALPVEIGSYLESNCEHEFSMQHDRLYVHGVRVY